MAAALIVGEIFAGIGRTQCCSVVPTATAELAARLRREVVKERLTVWQYRPILSYMVNYQERLDRTFAALVDPTRRAILAQLERKDGASISELAEPFAIKLPAVMKHLDVLDDAGLVTRSKSGRTVTVRLRPRPMREAMEWLRRYERFWSGSLDRLAAYAERKDAEARRRGR
jgi:DNA-binding transcriptional ArsR family regulator